MLYDFVLLWCLIFILCFGVLMNLYLMRIMLWCFLFGWVILMIVLWRFKFLLLVLIKGWWYIKNLLELFLILNIFLILFFLLYFVLYYFFWVLVWIYVLRLLDSKFLWLLSLLRLIKNCMLCLIWMGFEVVIYLL